MVTERLPANVTGRFVPFTTLPALACRPMNTASKRTGWVPNAFDSLIRKRSPHRSGLTIILND
jgi:hypothetical protein